MNRKIIAAIIMSSCLLGSALASDNRTAPNVFTSGSTISSSQMNENFGFLASEMREKSVYCDNGETISDAINAGYNSLTIYGSCSGAVGVYRMDPSPFGISYSDMPNKPTSFLLIQGGTGDGSDSITAPTSSNFKFFVSNNAFVQLHNLTLNSEVYIDDGSSVRFETVTINGHIEANNNSTALLRNSTLNGTTDKYSGSHK